MNDFFAKYISKITPVPFALEESGEINYIGGEKPLFTVHINKPLSKQELLTNTSLALSEAYMKGDIEVDQNIYDVINLLLEHIDQFKRNDHKLRHLLYTSRSIKNQKKEVCSHYDIGNDFYRLWLDQTMSYSCGYFMKEEDSLYDAQVQKVKHILKKLHLQKGQTLLDIGCGWGFLMEEAVKEYGVYCVGITLSEEQYSSVKFHVKKKGLEHQIEVELLDYRKLKEIDRKFDRVVSVGMLEHVGRGNYEEFLGQVNGVLKENGVALIHYISALKEYPGDAFIKKYIFPGGVIPSLREIINLLPEYDFYTLDVESLRRHYEKTLLCWRKNYRKHLEEIRATKGVEFSRMWDLYLASCASAFHNGVVDLHQILISKGAIKNWPLIRVE